MMAGSRAIQLRLLAILVTALTCHVHADQNQNKESCSTEDSTCQSLESLKYQANLDWNQKDSVNAIWDWIISQSSRTIITFCKSDKLGENEKIFTPVSEPHKCEKEGSNTKYEGSFDNNGLPKGPGKMEYAGGLVKPSVGRSCFYLWPGIHFIQARFVKGVPEGKSTIKYIDNSILVGDFHKGYIQGRGRLFDSKAQNELQMIASYKGGFVQGPAWILPPDYKQERKAILVHFHQGDIVQDNVILIDQKSGQATIGKLVNDTYLVDAIEMDSLSTSDYNCVKTIKIKKPEVTQKSRGKVIKLPVKIVANPEESRVHIRGSKILFFNRVAKTGSQSFIALLHLLGDRNGFRAKPQILQREFVWEPADRVAQVASEAANGNYPRAWIRHYAFIDYRKMGYNWNPDWFNVVRDPIERVISWFYYWRAAWNIVERKKAYPDEPLPDPEFLKKDFDTCVLTSDPECTFTQDESILNHNDHRSQVMQFCGHHPDCVRFNSPRALALAKENVEKYYKVVGLVEDINKTLTVAEAEMPEYFEGAMELFHSAPEVKKFRLKNAYKLPVSDEVMKLVTANFTNEIEFYRFCQQRLYSQYDSIKENE